MNTQMLLKLVQIKIKTNPHMDMFAILKNILKLRNYVSFSEKDELVKYVIKESFEIREDGSLKSFPTLRSKLFTEKLIRTYTDIEIDGNTYDVLAENELLTIVLSLFGNEYDICSKMLISYIDDIEKGFIKLEDL